MDYSGLLEQYGGYGVAVARELVELSVWVRLPVATQIKRSFMVVESVGALSRESKPD